MGFQFFGAIVFVFFIGLLAIAQEQADTRIALPVTSQTAIEARMFVSYTNAVVAYQINNPAFVGTISNSSLIAQGFQFSANFLTLVTNKITATGTVGRIITVSGTLPTGAIPTILKSTGNSAAYGISTGTSWVSSVYGTTSALASVVPAGSVVYVSQNGV